MSFFARVQEVATIYQVEKGNEPNPKQTKSSSLFKL